MKYLITLYLVMCILGTCVILWGSRGMYLWSAIFSLFIGIIYAYEIKQKTILLVQIPCIAYIAMMVFAIDGMVVADLLAIFVVGLISICIRYKSLIEAYNKDQVTIIIITFLSIFACLMVIMICLVQGYLPTYRFALFFGSISIQESLRYYDNNKHILEASLSCPIYALLFSIIFTNPISINPVDAIIGMLFSLLSIIIVHLSLRVSSTTTTLPMIGIYLILNGIDLTSSHIIYRCTPFFIGISLIFTGTIYIFSESHIDDLEYNEV